VPGPFWLLTALHLLTFVLHLAAMSALVGGIVVVLACPAPDRWSRPAVRRLLALFPVLMAATVTLGVAPLLFLQLSYGKIAYAAAITSAWPWFLVPFLAMAGYAWLYAASKRPVGDAAARGRLVLALASLLAVSLVYSATFSLAERPDAYGRLYASTASGWALNPDLATWLPRWVQAITGSIALGAFVTGLVARDDEAVRGAARRVLAGAAVLCAVAAGARFGLDGRLASALGSTGLVLFAAGAVLPLVAVALLGRAGPWPTGAALALGLVLAVAARHVARLGVLAGTFDPAAPSVRPQWDVFAVFVVCLLGAVAGIAWMLRAWFTAGRAPAR
jgi:hypothetical protein